MAGPPHGEPVKVSACAAQLRLQTLLGAAQQPSRLGVELAQLPLTAKGLLELSQSRLDGAGQARVPTDVTHPLFSVTALPRCVVG